MIYTDMEHIETNKFKQREKKYWSGKVRNLLSVSEGTFRNLQQQCSVFDKIFGYEIDRQEISEFAHMII